MNGGMAAYPFGTNQEYDLPLYRVRGAIAPTAAPMALPHGWSLLDQAGDEVVQLGEVLPFLPAEWQPVAWSQWIVPAIVGAAAGLGLGWFWWSD